MSLPLHLQWIAKAVRDPELKVHLQTKVATHDKQVFILKKYWILFSHIKHHNYASAISGNAVRPRMAGIAPAIALVMDWDILIVSIKKSKPARQEMLRHKLNNCKT